jgi:hypothetical protein
MTRVAWATAVGSLTLVAASVPLLFGSYTRRDEYWGATTIRRQWGIEREMLIDRDLNGRADVRIRYPGAYRKIAVHDVPDRIQIDNDLNGTFEIEWTAGPPPRLRIASEKGNAVFEGADAALPNQRLHIRSRDELGLNSGRQPGT